MDPELVRLFDKQVLAVYENAKGILGYNATRFLQKFRESGGLVAAKSWLQGKPNDKPTNGFLKLVDYGRLDISLEALVLRRPWNSLFSNSELEFAHSRLERYGYFLPAIEPIQRTDIIQESLENEKYTEGATSKIEVNRYERDRKAREACIKHYGPVCYVCDFDFASKYGSNFEGMIHVHHLVPLASINSEYIINPIADLRPVCPNCHAVIHQRKPCYNISEVKNLLSSTM